MSETQTIDTPAQEADTPTIEQLAEQLADIGSADADEQPQQNPQSPDEGSSQSQDTGDQETVSADGDQPDGAEKLYANDAAEKLGMDGKELFDRFTFKGPDGDEYTLGDMSNRFQDLKQSEALLAQASEKQLSIENDLLKKQQALLQQMQDRGIQLTEADLQQAEEQTKAYQQQQAARAVELMPEWADDTTRGQQVKEISELVTEYGFSEAEQSLFMDARLLKIMRDYSRQRAQIREVGKQYKKPKRKLAPKSHTEAGDNVTRLTQQVRDGKVSRESAVSELGKLLG